MMLTLLVVWTTKEMADTAIAPSTSKSFVRSNAKTRLVLSWIVWMPASCWISYLLSLAADPSDSTLLSEASGMVCFALGFAMLAYLAGINSVRGLMVRTSRANQSRAVTTGQSLSIWMPFLVLALNAFLRTSISDLNTLAAKDPSKRDEVLNSSKETSRISFCVGCDDSGGSHLMDSVPTPSTWQLCRTVYNRLSVAVYSLWSIRRMIIEGSLTTPILTKLLYVVQRGTKANNRAERIQLDGCVNHVCSLLKVPNNPQGEESRHRLGFR
eukprot:5585782-Amphidinium_carterae.1